MEMAIQTETKNPNAATAAPDWQNSFVSALHETTNDAKNMAKTTKQIKARACRRLTGSSGSIMKFKAFLLICLVEKPFIKMSFRREKIILQRWNLFVEIASTGFVIAIAAVFFAVAIKSNGFKDTAETMVGLQTNMADRLQTMDALFTGLYGDVTKHINGDRYPEIKASFWLFLDGLEHSLANGQQLPEVLLGHANETSAVLTELATETLRVMLMIRRMLEAGVVEDISNAAHNVFNITDIALGILNNKEIRIKLP